MTPVEIALAIVSVLMLVSRFVQAAKPLWDRLPKAVAVLLPPVVAVIPQVVDLVNQTKTWNDLVSYMIAAVGMVVVGLFPKPAEPEEAEEATRTGSATRTSSVPPPPPRSSRP